MRLFRVQENVPDVYSRKSRDFQLLCNIFDCVNSAVKYDIDSMIDIMDTQYISDRLLPLLQEKLGFFSSAYITNEQLRKILQGFCAAVKYKGSREGILRAIRLFLRMSNCSGGSKVYVVNGDNTLDEDNHYSLINGVYVIDVAIESDRLDVSILTEILKYILPAGYRLEYSFYNAMNTSDIIEYDDCVSVNIVETVTGNGIRPTSNLVDTIDYLNTGANYEQLEDIPSDWQDTFQQYYTYDRGKFISVLGAYPSVAAIRHHKNTTIFCKKISDNILEPYDIEGLDETEYLDDVYVLSPAISDEGELYEKIEDGGNVEYRLVESEVPDISGLFTCHAAEEEYAPIFEKGSYYQRAFNYVNVGGVSTTAVQSHRFELLTEEKDLPYYVKQSHITRKDLWSE